MRQSCPSAIKTPAKTKTKQVVTEIFDWEPVTLRVAFVAGGFVGAIEVWIDGLAMLKHFRDERAYPNSRSFRVQSPRNTGDGGFLRVFS
jgi:hypothetical protein